MNNFFKHIADSFSTNLIAEQRYQMILDGLQVTLLITFCAVLLGSLLGGVVCWARMNRRPWLRNLAKLYIDLMRGTPVLVLLMLMYYVFMAPLKATGIVVAIVTFAMNTSAYIGEMLRTGIEGIDKGQREAGLALGYTPRQVFLRIILPQVVRKIMPVYLGEVISLLKGTSIVGYIAVMDMTRASDLIRSRTFDAFFPLIITAAVYFLAAWLIGVLLNSLVQHSYKRSVIAATALLIMSMAGSVTSWIGTSDDFAETDNTPPLFRRLEGKRVGVIIGSTQDIAVTRFAPDAEIMRFSVLPDLIAALANGKVDIACQENITVNANPQIAATMDTVDVGLAPVPIAACFRLENTELQEDFNRYLTEIREDGTYNKMQDRWLGTENYSANQVPQQMGKGKTIRVATLSGMPPYNFISSGVPSGFEIDLVTQWANRRNYRIEFLIMDFASQIPAVQTGKADIALGLMSVTAERQKKVLFSDGYYESRTLFYTRKGESDILINEK